MERLIDICQRVGRDLEKYGICVVDNFMGKERAESIHRSVVKMYHSGVFVEGETVGLNSSITSSTHTYSNTATQNVRSDRITWVDGSESNCAHIAFLIATVDTIIMNFQRFKSKNVPSSSSSSTNVLPHIGGRTKVFYYLMAILNLHL